ncbi:class I SAM-dependent methyltransferase [Roseomonas sp. F4]
MPLDTANQPALHDTTPRPERHDSPGAGDNLLFFKSWMQAPLRAGAFKPSSPDLARAIAARVDPSIPGPVIELGPGTGAVTRALVERGVDPARLVLVEADPNFCALLRERWPQASVLQADAWDTPALLRDFDRPVAAVVAGLPLLIRPPSQRLRLVMGCLRQAVRGAPFVQFTYFVRSPVPAPRPGLRAHGSGMIWWNLWPARVWTYRLMGPQAVATW